MKSCPMCGTKNVSIGGLGNLSHYRCQACGMMYSGTLRRRPTKKASAK